MTDPSGKTRSLPALPDKFTLAIERGNAGLWYVTSDAHRGLLMAGRDLSEQLGATPAAIVELIEVQNGKR